MSLPNLFLIAAPRAGSTQLARWLDSHPDISLSGVKEPNHFSAHEFPPDYVRQTHLNDVPPVGPPARPAQFAIFRDRTAYQRLFAPLTIRWRLDASTTYLACPEAPAAIRKACPDARIILLTRDPLERALSHYRLALRTGRTRASLAQEIEAELSGKRPIAAHYLLRPSRQSDGVARVRASFPPDHILHLTFAELTRTPKAALSRIAAFLDVSDQFDMAINARNASAQPRFPFLNTLFLNTGAKTFVRRVLPTAWRPFARQLWFRDRKGDIPVAEIDSLRAALEQG